MSDLLEERKARVRAEWEAQCAKTRTGRKIPEWKGKTPDSKIPDAVRLRVTQTFENTCYLTGFKIVTETPDMEHVIPLSERGDHAEYNLRPALNAAHKIKSAGETERRAKADAAAKAKMGLKSRKGPPIKDKGFDPAEPQKKASKPPEKGGKLESIMALPRRTMFR
jgi:5-methylcytosine-specific restriction enzyme A